MGFYLMLGLFWPLQHACEIVVFSWFGIRQVIIVSGFVIIGSINRIGPLVFSNSCETRYTSYLSHMNLTLHNVCLDNQDGKRVRERLNDVHGTNNFCTWGNVACFSFLVIKSTHSSVILVSWFSFAVKSYFAGALEIIERRVVSYSSDHNSCITSWNNCNHRPQTHDLSKVIYQI